MMSTSSGSSQPSEQQPREDHIDRFLKDYNLQESSERAQTVVIGKPIVKYSKRSILDPNSPNKESAEGRESANLVFNNYPKGIWR